MGTGALGPYCLDEVLSRGPSATVYRARDTAHDDRVVALKVFHPALSADAAFRERFRRDAGLLSALREPHVVPIHRYGEIDGAFVLDMRLVRGRSLAETLRAGPLDPSRARAIGQQVTAAREALRHGGLGDRPLDRGDVLLTGSPARGEFVQLVGLGLGRPLTGAPADVDALVRPPARWTPSSTPPGRRRVLLAATAVLVVAAAVLTSVVAVSRGGPGPPGPPAEGGTPALVATIDVPVGVVDADTTEFDGKRVLVAATEDGSIRTWDLATGEVVRPAIAGDAVAVGTATLGGRTVVVARHGDATVHVHDLATGAAAGPVIDVPEPGQVLETPGAALDTVELNGAPVVVLRQETGASVPDLAGTPTPQIGLRPFSLPGGTPAGPLMSEDGYTIGAHAVAEVGGRPVVASIAGPRLQVRDLATGAQVGVPTPPQPAALHGLVTGVRDGRPVALTGGDDNAVRIWDLRTGEQVGPPLLGHTAAVYVLATVRLGTRTVLISTAGGYPDPDRSEVRFWDLATGDPLGTPLVGHPLGHRIAAASGGETAFLVAAQPGEPITVWDVQRLIAGEAP